MFSFSINYNTPTLGLGSTPLYNGNISQTTWKTASDNIERSYKYRYDPLSRITSAIDNTADQRYSLTNVSYDKNGNITGLQRNGHLDPNVTSFGLMDDLTYTYTGNQLQAVDDDPLASSVTGFIDGAEAATEYTYDENGNMLTDANKGITGVIYNHLNLPEQVSINGGTINYVYSADGTKLKKTVSGGNTTEYANGYVYEGGSLQFFPHAEGYLTPKDLNDVSLGFDYVYQFKDHLNNIRLSYTDSDPDPDVEVLEIIEENNYYPFGLKMRGFNELNSALGNSVAERWKFGGNEYQEELNLGWYDITARNYNPELGRWMNIDPLAEKMRRHSPYNYAFDNPVFFLDADGMMPTSTTTGGREKIILSQKSSGVTNAYSLKRGRVAGRAYCALCNQSSRSVYTPGANKNFSGVSKELSAMRGSQGGLTKVLEAVTGVSNFFSSVSETTTTTQGTYYDAEGNKVDGIEGASTFVVNETTTTETISFKGTTTLDETTEISTTTTTTKFNVADDSFLEKQDSVSKTTLTNGNIDDVSSTLKTSAEKIGKINSETMESNLNAVEGSWLEGQFQSIYEEALIEESQSTRGGF